jgi:hypothetical protein
MFPLAKSLKIRGAPAGFRRPRDVLEVSGPTVNAGR